MAERTKIDADLAAQRSARDKADAEAASQQALKSAAEKSEREKQELRSKLVLQLNLILQTRDSARGLIVNMSDVLFDSGQFSLKPGGFGSRFLRSRRSWDSVDFIEGIRRKPARGN